MERKKESRGPSSMLWSAIRRVGRLVGVEGEESSPTFALGGPTISSRPKYLRSADELEQSTLLTTVLSQSLKRRQRNQKGLFSSPTEIKDDWTQALQDHAFPEEFVIQYSDIFARHRVTLQKGAKLSDAECQELGVLVGHRDEIRTTASNAVYNKLHEVVAADDEESALFCQAAPFDPTVLLGAPLSSAEARPIGNDGGVDKQPHSLSTPNDNKGLGNGLPNERLAPTLLIPDDPLSTLAVAERRNRGGLSWRAVSGGAATMVRFLECMKPLVTQECSFPVSFCRSLYDNKPMPFHDQDGSSTLVVLRIPDLDDELGTTVAHISNRLVVMFNSTTKVILTYHRCDKDPLDRLARDWDDGLHSNSNLFQVVDSINKLYIQSFRLGLKKLQDRSDELDDEQDMELMVEGLTHVQKKAAVYKRCLSAGRQALEELKELRGLEDYIPLICETAQSFESMLDEVAENAVGTINMQMALDGFHSSRNTKVFTYISLLCQPITVATGWYGMNYVNMPELEDENGYFIFAGVTLGFALLLVLLSAYFIEMKQ